MKNAAEKFMKQLTDLKIITLDKKSNEKINEFLIPNLNILYEYDSPDIPIIYDNKVVALEEFEFDSSKTKKKSSKQKKRLLNLKEIQKILLIQ